MNKKILLTTIILTTIAPMDAMNRVLTKDCLRAMNNSIGRQTAKGVWDVVRNSSLENKIMWITSLVPIPYHFMKNYKRRDFFSDFKPIDPDSKLAKTIQSNIDNISLEDIFVGNQRSLVACAFENKIYLHEDLLENTNDISTCSIINHEKNHIDKNHLFKLTIDIITSQLFMPMITPPVFKIIRLCNPIKLLRTNKSSGKIKQFFKGFSKGLAGNMIANAYQYKKFRSYETEADQMLHPDKFIQLELIRGCKDFFEKLNAQHKLLEETYNIKQPYDPYHPSLETRIADLERQEQETLKSF